MKIRKKNQGLKDLISNLNSHGHGKGSDLWIAVARGLNRPKRRGYEVNLFSLDRSAGSKETVVVPGSVLGSGEIKKALTVAALRFSAEAREKIEKAGGKCMSIPELLEKNPKGHRIRIMG
jgi:large subunit ribosomal protein L18e